MTKAGEINRQPSHINGPLLRRNGPSASNCAVKAGQGNGS